MNPLADAIFRAYLDARDHHANPYPRASSGFAQSRHVSACCGHATTLNRRGDKLLCAFCRRECDLRHLEQRRALVGDGGPYITLRETRTIDRGAAERKLEGVLRRAALCRMVERRPRELRLARWRFDLRAWELATFCGVARAVPIGRARFGELGKWTEWTVRVGVEEAREVVEKRAAREPVLARAVAA